MSSAFLEIAPDVAAALTLPDPARLAEDQRRGAECVWCSERLNIETAIDLGEHTAQAREDSRDLGGRWYPRGCRACLHTAANRALKDHAPRCEQCVDDVSRCDAGMALTRLMREARS